jgi:signal peptidase I
MATSTAVSPARIHTELPHVAPATPRENPITLKIRTNGSVCFRVLGQSMFPWIRSGDYVFVRRCAFESVSAGDVILYERDRRLFVHRVLRRAVESRIGNGRKLLITKGDSLDGKDAPLTESEFLGRVTRIHRGQQHLDLESLGRVALGRFLALVSPASVLLYGPLRALKHLLFG